MTCFLFPADGFLAFRKLFYGQFPDPLKHKYTNPFINKSRVNITPATKFDGLYLPNYLTVVFSSNFRYQRVFPRNIQIKPYMLTT